MTPEERIRMLRTAQQNSQFGGAGPVLVGNVEPEPIDEPSLPGATTTSESRPSTQQQAAAIIKDREEAAKNAAVRKRMDAQSGRRSYDRRKQGYQTAADVGADIGAARASAAKAAAAAEVHARPTTPLEPLPPAPAQDSLTPAEAAALRKKYENSGHTQNMTYEEWYDANFSGDTPEDVKRSASYTPRYQAARDRNLPPGEASGLAKSRVAAGKPLPEGRDSSQYSPDQRRTMQRNVHNPEVPMQQFGGTFTHNVDGSMSSRAPNPQALRDADAIAAEQGAGSASHTMALALAYGIDASQYGDDMDLLKADVAREKERHDRLSQKYDIVDNGMGGFRYKPNSAMNEMVERRKNVIRLDEYGKRFAGMLTPEQENEIDAELEAMGATPHEIMRLKRDRGIAQAVRNNVANRNMTIAMNNPRVAQGLYLRSLQQAAQSGDPLQIASVHEAFGNERAAADYRNLAGIQSQVAGQALAAEAEARKAAEPEAEEKTLAQRLEPELQSALAMQNDEQRRIAVRTVLDKMGYPPDQIEAATDRIIRSAAGTPIPTSGGGLWSWLWSALHPSEASAGQGSGTQGALPPAPVQGPAAPTASGRGGTLDRFYNAIPSMPTLPQVPARLHPYAQRGGA